MAKATRDPMDHRRFEGLVVEDGGKNEARQRRLVANTASASCHSLAQTGSTTPARASELPLASGAGTWVGSSAPPLRSLAYLGGFGRTPGAETMKVVQVVDTAPVMMSCGAFIARSGAGKRSRKSRIASAKASLRSPAPCGGRLPHPRARRPAPPPGTLARPRAGRARSPRRAPEVGAVSVRVACRSASTPPRDRC